MDDRLMHHQARIQRLRRASALSSISCASIDWSSEPQSTSDPDRLGELTGLLDHHREIAVLLLAEADIAGIDAVFVQRFGACRMVAQERVADIVEVADERHGDAHAIEGIADMRHGGGRLAAVDGDAHELGAGAGQLGHLAGGRRGIGGVGIRHRLHHDRGAATDGDMANFDADAARRFPIAE